MKSLFCLFAFLFASVAVAETALTVNARQHADRSSIFSDSPYGEDDVSLGVYVDIFEGVGAWRFGASYADDLSGVPGVNSVITPQISLLVVDGIWETSLGALIDYVDTDADADWGDMYFQWALGINLPLTNSLSFGIHVQYPFEDFDGLIDFDSDLMEWTGAVRFRF